MRAAGAGPAARAGVTGWPRGQPPLLPLLRLVGVPVAAVLALLAVLPLLVTLALLTALALLASWPC